MFSAPSSHSPPFLRRTPICSLFPASENTNSPALKGIFIRQFVGSLSTSDASAGFQRAAASLPDIDPLARGKENGLNGTLQLFRFHQVISSLGACPADGRWGSPAGVVLQRVTGSSCTNPEWREKSPRPPSGSGCPEQIFQPFHAPQQQLTQHLAGFPADRVRLFPTMPGNSAVGVAAGADCARQ